MVSTVSGGQSRTDVESFTILLVKVGCLMVLGCVVAILMLVYLHNEPNIVERTETFRSPYEDIVAAKVIRSDISSALGAQEESMFLRVRGDSATVVPFGFFRIRRVEWRAGAGGLHLALVMTRLAKCDESVLVKQVGGVVVDYTISDYPK
jgi:hypothetical protein